jgi:murein DD-endopeptidase MepM/ murein hydrolase activator NlpD
MDNLEYLWGSVGANGQNSPHDVKIVQNALKRLQLYNGSVNGRCDMWTIYAIREYQSNFMFAPNGLINVQSETWRHLSDPSYSLSCGAYDPSKVVLKPVEEKKALRWPLEKNRIRNGNPSAPKNIFGMVRNNGTRGHHGWDLQALSGTECYAVSAGKVVYVGDGGSNGKMVIIDLNSIQIGGQKVYATYTHLSSFDVTNGIEVIIGQLVGKTGTTGNAAGMTGENQHLHFELRKIIFPPGPPSAQQAAQMTAQQNLQGALERLNYRYNPSLLYGDPPYTTVEDPL